MKPMRIVVRDKMQNGYVYWRTKPMGVSFAPGSTRSSRRSRCWRSVSSAKIHDRLPERISGELVHAREVIAGPSSGWAELFRRERITAARSLAKERLASSGRSARLVPMVLPLLLGPAAPGRSAADQAMARCPATHNAVEEALRTTRSDLPLPPTPGASPLGVRFEEHLRSRLRRGYGVAGEGQSLRPPMISTAACAMALGMMLRRQAATRPNTRP